MKPTEKKDRPAKDGKTAIFLAWLLPGTGHLYWGDRERGGVFLVLIFGLYGWGFWLGAGEIVDPSYYQLSFAAQVLAGFPTMMGLVITMFMEKSVTYHPALDVGALYTVVAALFNGLAVVHLYRLTRGMAAPGVGRTDENGEVTP